VTVLIVFFFFFFLFFFFSPHLGAPAGHAAYRRSNGEDSDGQERVHEPARYSP
jgi:hypothetical protein